VRFLRQAVAR